MGVGYVSTGKYIFCYLMVNGNRVKSGSRTSEAVNVFAASVVSADLKLVAGDYVEVGYYTDTTHATKDLLTDEYCNFSGHMVGAL